jgi:RNA polymerase sigma-B factor
MSTVTPLADFAEFQISRDPRLREDLVRAYRNLAYMVARRFAGRGEEMEELEQVALMALDQAIERFDPARGTAFSTFAVPTIAGTLKRHFRDHTWALRPPRQLQERYLAVSETIDRLTAELCRTPTIEEVAADGDWSRSEVDEAQSVGRARRSCEHLCFNEPDVPDPGEVDPQLRRVEDREIVNRLLGRLEARERRVVELRFFEGLSQSRIGERFGVSQVHVSRLLSTSMETLRRAALEHPVPVWD